MKTATSKLNFYSFYFKYFFYCRKNKVLLLHKILKFTFEFFRILIVKDKNVQFMFFGKVVFQIILGLKYNKNFSKIHFVQRGG